MAYKDKDGSEWIQMGLADYLNEDFQKKLKEKKEKGEDVYIQIVGNPNPPPPPPGGN